MMFPKKVHDQIYFWSLVFLAVSLPLSIFFTSVFQFVLIGNWIAEAKFREKWIRFRSDPALWIFLALFLIHLLGMTWTNNLDYGLKDLRIKLPLLVLPLVVGTVTPLTKKQTDLILHFFVGAVCVATLASVFALTGLLPGEINDFRDISLFISHIRFALLIVLAIAISFYFLFLNDEKLPVFLRWFYPVNLVWMPLFLIALKSLSGIVIFIILTYLFLLRLTFRIRDISLRFMVFVFILIIPLVSLAYVGTVVKRFYTVDPIESAEIDLKTNEGNLYMNLSDRKEIENGHHVWMYVCISELEREWNRVSDIDFNGITANGNSLQHTLIRYMTSMGLRKDAVGFSRLTDKDIKAIEKGIANQIYLKKFSLYPRIYEIIWEIHRVRLGYSPNDKSIVQRWLYLEAGLSIAGDHFWTGVGTGDIPDAFNAYYEKVQSPLETDRRRRAHNQFLTFVIAFGIFGFMACMAAILVPVWIRKKWDSCMTVVFLVIMGLSMMNEDTIETSAGAASFAFFYVITIFGPHYKWFRDG
ncbi:MAG: O-antigen ligase family protein [Bacteroidales bacterium]|nr:O-antigen ligase family protein [Bacteroidales bacterium]MBN2698682.1 O-antigen ligase family protein [Bacteroidales bacterium]